MHDVSSDHLVQGPLAGIVDICGNEAEILVSRVVDAIAYVHYDALVKFVVDLTPSANEPNVVADLRIECLPYRCEIGINRLSDAELPTKASSFAV